MKIEKKSKKLLEADLTPMIDMTFQLIAFFMVLTNFTNIDQNQLINLPSSELAKPPDEQVRYDITLNLTADPPLELLPPGYTPESPDEGWVILAGRPKKIGTLGNSLEAEVSIALSQKYKMEQINVIIRADKNSRAKHLYDLIDECKKNSLEQFALRVMEEAN